MSAPHPNAPRTDGWASLGIALIVIGAALYGLVAVLGGAAALGGALILGGPITWPVLLMVLPVVLGFAILIIKVIVDRVTSAEDRYYSKNVDQ